MKCGELLSSFSLPPQCFSFLLSPSLAFIFSALFCINSSCPRLLHSLYIFTLLITALFLILHYCPQCLLSPSASLTAQQGANYYHISPAPLLLLFLPLILYNMLLYDVMKNTVWPSFLGQKEQWQFE